MHGETVKFTCRETLSFIQIWQ